MKTNHQRNFKNKRDSISAFTEYIVISEAVSLNLGDKSFSANVC